LLSNAQPNPAQVRRTFIVDKMDPKNAKNLEVLVKIALLIIFLMILIDLFGFPDKSGFPFHSNRLVRLKCKIEM
jgi:hypothetical protein